jgi:hypothetical protein
MTAKQEMLLTLLDKKTIDRVVEQFASGKEKVFIDNFEMYFRLYKSKANSINLEVFVQHSLGAGPEENLAGLGLGRIEIIANFWQPIGFFSKNSALEIEVTTLKKFENELDIVLDERNSSIKINKLDLRSNAVVAAFSVEAAANANYKKDTSFLCNGLECDIFMTHDRAYPQFFLNDKYGIPEAICAYWVENESSLNPTIEYKELFDDLHSMELLSAFKVEKYSKRFIKLTA